MASSTSTFSNLDVQKEENQAGRSGRTGSEDLILPSSHETLSDQETVGRKNVVTNENETKASSRLLSALEPVLLKDKSLDDNAGIGARLRHAVLCPPHGRLGDLLAWTLLILTLWGAAVAILGPVALPMYEPLLVEIQGGTVFSVLVLVVVAYLGGWLVSLVKLPPLLGMLIVGLILKNIANSDIEETDETLGNNIKSTNTTHSSSVLLDVARGLDPNWSSALRSIALAVILLRAGLGLDPQALKQLSAMVFRLAFSPCLAETLVVAVTSVLLLDMSWLWGFMLGFVLAAVSPAVVVPCLLSLQERGLGVKKGIPTLVIAAASVDDVLAISAFTILLGVTFNSNQENLALLILQGPLEAVVGVVWGILWGLLMIILPPSPNPSILLRILLLVGGSLLALFGSTKVGLPGSGALAVLVMGFVTGLGWRRQGWGDDNPVSRALASMWIVLQPLLFGLIGTEIQVSKLEVETVGYGVAVLACGISVRIVVSYLAVLGGELTHRERLFVALAWLPKATVQAAIGPLALDMAKNALKAAEESGVEDLAPFKQAVEWGEHVLTIAVLVILITAPIGAVAIMSSGPKFLEQSVDVEKEEERVEKGNIKEDLNKEDDL